MKSRTVESITLEIETLESMLKRLRAERRKVVRNMPDALMMVLLSVIGSGDGMTRKEIKAKTKTIKGKTYTNKMTALVRRGLIVNKGTRRNPVWYVVES
jgi:predicted HTH transcriptional regulator